MISKSKRVLMEASTRGIKSAEAVATMYGLSLFAVDVGPGSRVEVWNKAWNRKLATGHHVSKYAA
jgi:hypothetical protein